MSDNVKDIILLHGHFESEFFDDLKKKKTKTVFILEGRPDLSSSKASIKELLKRKIKPTLIADNMAGFLFSKKMVKEVHLSYQQRDENGVMAQVGSLILAVLGFRHKVKVVMHQGSKKLKLMGKSKDILEFANTRVAPKGVKGYVPLLEVVPEKYITARDL